MTYTICFFKLGAILCLLGILLLIRTPFDLLMEERLKMRPGLPPFEWWKQPKPEIRLKVYIFNVTNAEEFIENRTTNLKLLEFGPIIYREHIRHTNLVHHWENSTLTYTVHRYLEFLPNENEPDVLNKTIIIPNTILLGMAAEIHDYSYFFKVSFKIMSKKETIFLKTTIYDFLWNLTSPTLMLANKFVPFMVPTVNAGALANVYKDFKDRINVKIGKKHGYENFFKITGVNGRTTVPGFEYEYGKCDTSIENSTEGALYQNFLTKDTILLYWRKTVCRPIPLIFDQVIYKGNILSYKFIAREDMYDRLKNLSLDCYKEMYGMYLEDGVSDISKCFKGMPLVISAPHFYGRMGTWNIYLNGFNPSKEAHGSYAVIEPITGVPLEQCARSQSNMFLPKLEGFIPEVERFSKMILPMFWLEYRQDKVTEEIDSMIIFIVNILPTLQRFLSYGLISISIILFIIFIIAKLRI